MHEMWKPIVGWPYEASNLGRFRNSRTGRLRKTVPHKSGYLNIQLRNAGQFKTCQAHRLVAIAFHGEPPSPKHEVAHRNGNRHDNAASNLRWVLHVENMRDRDSHGTTARGTRNGKLKYSDDQVSMVRELHASGLGNRRISKMTGIPRQTVMAYMKGSRRATLERVATPC